jgi:Mn2+/Fe2+ NRAMP family transporter
LTPSRGSYRGVFGPGFVAGASNNDPTTVAALAVVGASTGYDLVWLVVLVLPMLAVVQVIAATVGSVTGAGLQAALLRLFTSRFARIERVLAFATLGFAAYAVSTLLAHPDWGAVAHAFLVPAQHWDVAHASGAIALLGTTLTSYVYYWESIEVSRSGAEPARVGRAKRDAVTGLAFSDFSFFFILVGTAATLGVNRHPVLTVADAALALEPLAGRYATLVFACGLLASAVIAIPVIAATIGFVTGETCRFKTDLDAPPAAARRFYGVLAASLLLGAALAALGPSPVTLLVDASIAGGLATPLTLAMLVAIGRDRTVMGEQRIGLPLAAAGIAITAIVAVCSVAYLATSWPAAASLIR